MLEAEPENGQVAAELAQLLLAKLENESTTRWKVLRPTEMNSVGGATLTLQGDGSILASGKNPEQDVYTVFAKTDLERITSVRLETLPHPTLPHHGPGRFPGDGNFYISELRVLADGAPVPLTDISVAYDELGEARRLIDGAVDNGVWSNVEWAGKKNTAVVATRIDHTAEGKLEIEIRTGRWAAQPGLLPAGSYRRAHGI